MSHTLPMNEESHMIDPTTLLLVLMISGVPATGHSESGTSSTPRIDQRQETQQHINQGAASGTLTEKEANRPQNKQEQ
jgi:hypothetical protein